MNWPSGSEGFIAPSSFLKGVRPFRIFGSCHVSKILRVQIVEVCEKAIRKFQVIDESRLVEVYLYQANVRYFKEKNEDFLSKKDKEKLQRPLIDSTQGRNCHPRNCVMEVK